jgi:hypothetical protein
MTGMWVSHQGGSDNEPTPEQMQQWRRRMSPPENEFPAGVGLAALLGHTDYAAVGITQIEAFSTGFRFTLAVRLRQVPPELARGGLYMLVGSHPRPGIEVPLERRLLLGIEYPDGERASTLHDMRMLGLGKAVPDQQLLLVPQAGNGGEQSVDQTYWVSPLPPAGPVTVVLAWPAFGMPESRTILDGAIIRTAAKRSQMLWPLPPLTQAPMPPPPPDRPSTGWFADPSQ